MICHDNPGGYTNIQRDGIVELLFKNARLQRQCSDMKEMVKAFGTDQAKKLKVRLDDLDAAPTLELVRSLPGHFHELKGDRAGQIACSLAKGVRLVFEAANEPRPLKEDGGLDWHAVTSVRILEVGDYHD